jgi:hypothetical protein
MTRVHRMDGSTKNLRPTRAHSGILLDLKVVLLPAAVWDKTHKRKQAVLGKYEANIKQNARKVRIPLIHLLTQTWLQIRASGP